MARLFASAALAMSVIALWTGFAGKGNSGTSIVQAAELSVRYMRRDWSGSQGSLEVIIPVVDGFDETYEFSPNDKDYYKLRLSSKMDRVKALNYEVQFCHVVEDDCVDIRTPRLSVVPGQTRSTRTRTRSAVGPNGEVVTLNLYVLPMPVPPAAPKGKSFP